MCGRYTLIQAAKAYHAYLRRTAGGEAARYNIAPGQMCEVIRLDEGGDPDLEELFWGFVPRWTKPGEKPAPIVNARAETVASKPAFRDAFRRRRCLVPADGFYEWKKAEGKRLPYFFRLRGGRPFAFAGLWEEWEAEPGRREATFCLLTTAANAVLADVHDRMPVMLTEAVARRWLGATAAEAPEVLPPLLGPFPAEEMEVRPVDPWVNKAGNEGPRCLEPPPADDAEQMSFL